MTAWLHSQATFSKIQHFVGAFIRVRWRSSLRPTPLLTADPIRALIDEKIRIRAGFLPPLSPVTLWTQMHCEEGDLWQSFAHYNTDSEGTVDLCRDASVGGSYVGCEPMGLFWALQPAPGGREGLRLRKRNVQTPYVFHVSLLEGHFSPGEESTELAAFTAERWYMAPGVKRIEVRQHGLVGTLFLPPGPGPFPAMLDMWGMGGGLLEYRSALLASRGYATFSLAYFRVKEIPGPLNRINVRNKYFKTAFQFLQNHEQVCSDRVGILGLSYGCYLTLTIATLPGVKPSCLVCINGPVGSFVPLSDTEDRVVSLDDNLKHWEFDDQGIVTFKFLTSPKNVSPENIVPIEKINCPVMSIVGEDDLNSASLENANMLEERLKAAGKGHLLTRLSYPGAGHLIEPPYAPNTRISLFSVKPKKLFTLWGGHLAPHAAAQEDAWRQVLDFLDVHLRGDRG